MGHFASASHQSYWATRTKGVQCRLRVDKLSSLPLLTTTPMSHCLSQWSLSWQHQNHSEKRLATLTHSISWCWCHSEKRLATLTHSISWCWCHSEKSQSSPNFARWFRTRIVRTSSQKIFNAKNRAKIWHSIKKTCNSWPIVTKFCTVLRDQNCEDGFVGHQNPTPFP